MMTSMCLRMLCQLLMMLTFCFLFANSTDPYDADGRINGSGYENFSADDLKDINGGHDDATPITTSNSFEPEASSSSNHFERPPITSGTYSNDDENYELNWALEESQKDILNKVIEKSKKEYEQQLKRASSMKASHSSDKQYKDNDNHSSSTWRKFTSFSKTLLLRKSSDPKTKSDSSKPNLSRSKSMAHHSGTSSAKKGWM